jgi:hypothetical protein
VIFYVELLGLALVAGGAFCVGSVHGQFFENRWFRHNLPSEFTTRLPANVMRRLGRWS